MGLSRDIREINRQILTDKQERQQERQQEQQEKKELKEATLKEKLMFQGLENKIKDKINFYLSIDFCKYKNDLYLFQTKENIKDEILNPKPKGIKTPLKKEDFDFTNDKIQLKELMFLYFDKLYYKTLKEQIKMHEMNQKAINYYIQQQQEVQEVQQQLQNIKQEAKSDVKSIATTLIKTTLQVLINCGVAVIGIFAMFCHPVNYKKRRF